MVSYRSYHPLNCQNLTRSQVVERLKFLNNFYHVKISNLHTNYLPLEPLVKGLNLKNQVVVLLEQAVKGVDLEVKFKRFFNTPRKFFKNLDLFNWYLFYLKKGVFVSRLEPHLKKLEMQWAEL